MKKTIKNSIKKTVPFVARIYRNYRIKMKIIEIYNDFKDNWIDSHINQGTTGYKIILEQHALEKGMTSKEPRPFGMEKIDNLIKYILLFEKYDWKKDYSYNVGISILFKYVEYYEKRGWIDRDEYKKVKTFIRDRKTNVETGTLNIHRSTILNKNFDYDCFLSGRHSVREFMDEIITTEDMTRSVKMAMKTPTACNRQMCKVYYVKNKNVKNEIIKFSRGLTNFDLESTNLVLITYDMNMCFAEEIQQGMFNAGLFAMNLVNAFHSIGIGSCFLEYNNSIKEEKMEKKILNIPPNEKIAVVIAAGYYPEKTVVPKSTRKPIEEIYREII